MKIIKPREELRKYVRYYWVLESDEPFSVPTFPIGCPQLIFHRGKPLFIPELEKSQDNFTISGQVNFPSHLKTDGKLDMIVAVFYPHTISLFIDTPPSAFYNQEISGYDIGNRQLNEIANKILYCESALVGVRFLEDWLMTRLRHSLNIERIGYSLETLLLNPSITITALADTACLSKKQYERIFRVYIGMNPKEYARVVRFQKSMHMMQQGNINYADIAVASGYSDQSHFIREFKSMTGHTPKSLLNICQPHSDLFTNPV
ncbi:MAG: helix-turn-helix transcriptional regulator [Muribaculaceae bacterium]|nr:helix-turn-helix transcriptional regulator [Muribaculaceae bacterium]